MDQQVAHDYVLFPIARSFSIARGLSILIRKGLPPVLSSVAWTCVQANRHHALPRAWLNVDELPRSQTNHPVCSAKRTTPPALISLGTGSSKLNPSSMMTSITALRQLHAQVKCNQLLRLVS